MLMSNGEGKDEVSDRRENEWNGGVIRRESVKEGR